MHIWTGIYIGSFFILLSLFWYLKLPALSLPYYWDELGVYAPGALYMYDNGPGLLPAALDPELSRGHPLLLYFLHACSFRLFGPTLITGHTTALVITTLFLVLFFIEVFRLLGGWQALAAAAILIAQPLFFAQSALILPEMMLAMCMFMAVSAFVRNKMGWYIFWGVLAIMTKETGVIIPLGVIAFQVLDYLLQKGDTRSFAWRKTLLALTPWLSFLLFISIQRMQNGWFFFPYHMDLMQAGSHHFIILLKAYSRFVFYLQGRWMMSAILLLAGPVLLLTLPKDRRRMPMLTASIIFIAGGIFYSMLIFYMSRYILMVLPFLVVSVVIVIAALREKHWSFILLVPLLVWAGWSQMECDAFHVDTDMGYVKVVGQTEQAVHYTLEQLGRKEKVVANFPLFFALKDPRNGYYPNPEAQPVIVEYRKDADYALITNLGPQLKDFQPGETEIPIKIFPVFDKEIKLYRLDE